MTKLTRRRVLVAGTAGAAFPTASLAITPRELSWDDLVPNGVPYGEIIGEGEIDQASDTWRPVFDANATRLNASLHGAYVRLPGFIIPIEQSSDGVSEFVLVPYVGACIHTPPPPPNQLVLVQAANPWPGDKLWDPVWVIGRMRAQLQSTAVAETGYTMSAEKIEPYKW